MKKTIDHIKEKRTVSEELTKKRKEFTRIRKLILKSLETEPKTIPQIAQESELPLDVVTYNLMTLRKYGEIETGEIDDSDEYFYYQAVKKKKDTEEE
jgi:predicted Rossmann fold nucleotide-binding protein DprA/Smf involved in DNA uptake